MTISLILDHFRAVKKWTAKHGADAKLDMNTFQLTVQSGDQGFRLHPMFPVRHGNQISHSTVLTDGAIGFGGWLPYQRYRSRWSTDKLLFKRDAAKNGIRVPAQWAAGDQPTGDYILKRSQGSFGYDLTGPFRATVPLVDAGIPNPAGRGEVFAEQFVEGRMAKVWFWGAQAFFVHLQEYPWIVGDGNGSTWSLAKARIERDVGAAILSDDNILQASLAYQGLNPDDLLPVGQQAWIDFRYGRSFEERRGKQDGNSLHALLPRCDSQIRKMGHFIAGVLQEVSPVPLMCSVDAVLDASDQLWWLEMNTNSILPHHGYDLILCSLFDRPYHAETPLMPKIHTLTQAHDVEADQLAGASRLGQVLTV